MGGFELLVMFVCFSSITAYMLCNKLNAKDM